MAVSPDKRTLTLTLKKPLPAGTYEVRWQAAAGRIGVDMMHVASHSGRA